VRFIDMTFGDNNLADWPKSRHRYDTLSRVTYKLYESRGAELCLPVTLRIILDFNNRPITLRKTQGHVKLNVILYPPRLSRNMKLLIRN